MIDWFSLGMGLFGGLALFLAGLELLSDGLRQAAGATLKTLLGTLTRNRFLGALTGAVVTGVLNSSSVTTVLVVGFVTAGVMSLSQSVGVIMGANIGSTVTAQILAFNLSEFALLPIAVGFFMTFGDRSDRTKQLGMMVMGLGLVFYGMGIMSEAMTPLRDFPPFMEFLRSMEAPAVGILAGAVFTGLVQSSAATVGIAIAMASEGLLSLPAGIALALGANIGTCVTAMLASLGKPTEARRAAVVHVAFNVAGVLVWVGMLPLLADIAVNLSPQSPELSGTARAAAEVPRQIANANTLFNVVNTFLFIGFTGLFARLAEKIIPERPPKGAPPIIEPAYLDEEAIRLPAVALENVRREFGRAGDIAVGMLADLRTALIDGDRTAIAEVRRRDDQVDLLERAILEYLALMRQGELTTDESKEIQALMTAIVNLETLADVIETDMVDLAERALDTAYDPGEQTRGLLREFYEAVHRALELAVAGVRDNDERAANEAMLLKEDVRRLAESFIAHKSDRMGERDTDYMSVVRLELSLVDKLRHLYTLTKRIAKANLPASLADKD